MTDAEAVVRVKRQLGAEQIEALLGPLADAGDTWWRGLVAASTGERVRTRVSLEVTGLKWSDVEAWLSRETDLPPLVAATPETYVMRRVTSGPTAGTSFVMRGKGEHIMRYVMSPVKDGNVCDHVSPESHVIAADVSLQDGVEACRGVHSFAETPDGFKGFADNYWPSAISSEFARNHEKTVAMQWVNFTRMTARSIHAEPTIRVSATAADVSLERIHAIEQYGAERALALFRELLGDAELARLVSK